MKNGLINKSFESLQMKPLKSLKIVVIGPVGAEISSTLIVTCQCRLFSSKLHSRWSYIIYLLCLSQRIAPGVLLFFLERLENVGAMCHTSVMDGMCECLYLYFQWINMYNQFSHSSFFDTNLLRSILALAQSSLFSRTTCKLMIPKNLTETLVPTQVDSLYNFTSH